MDVVLEGLLIGIVSSVIVVVLPLAYKLRNVVNAHKTVLGKINAVITYMKAHPTTDKQLETLIEDVANVIELVK